MAETQEIVMDEVSPAAQAAPPPLQHRVRKRGAEERIKELVREVRNIRKENEVLRQQVAEAQSDSELRSQVKMLQERVMEMAEQARTYRGEILRLTEIVERGSDGRH